MSFLEDFYLTTIKIQNKISYFKEIICIFEKRAKSLQKAITNKEISSVGP
jgi:hypothetical protein